MSGRRGPSKFEPIMSSAFSPQSLEPDRSSPGPSLPGGVKNVQQESLKLHGAAAEADIAWTNLFVASFARSRRQVPWVVRRYPPELYPLRVCGKAVALSIFDTLVLYVKIRALLWV